MVIWGQNHGHFRPIFPDFRENARPLHQNFSARSSRILLKSGSSASSRRDLAFEPLFSKIRDDLVEKFGCKDRAFFRKSGKIGRNPDKSAEIRKSRKSHDFRPKSTKNHGFLPFHPFFSPGRPNFQKNSAACFVEETQGSRS